MCGFNTIKSLHAWSIPISRIWFVNRTHLYPYFLQLSVEVILKLNNLCTVQLGSSQRFVRHIYMRVTVGIYNHVNNVRDFELDTWFVFKSVLYCIIISSNNRLLVERENRCCWVLNNSTIWKKKNGKKVIRRNNK